MLKDTPEAPEKSTSKIRNADIDINMDVHNRFTPRGNPLILPMRQWRTFRAYVRT